MSGSKTNEPRGFLGTDDLDLDAWDATFDALHVPTEGSDDLAPENAGPQEEAFAPEFLAEGEGLIDLEGGQGLDASSEEFGEAGIEAEIEAGIEADAASAAEFGDPSADAFEFSVGPSDDTRAVTAEPDGAVDLDELDDGGEGRDAADGDGAVPSPAYPRSASELDVERAFAEEPSESGDQTRADLSAADAGEEGGEGADAGALELEAEEAGDFEDVNTVELGDAVMLAEFHNFEEAARRSRASQRTFAAVVPRDPARGEAAKPRVEPPTWASDADGDVYTSAARPATSSDVAARPAVPSASPAPVRTGRNVLARTVTPQAPSPAMASARRRGLEDDAPLPLEQSFDAQESTRIAGFDELESNKSASRVRPSEPAIARTMTPASPFAEPVAVVDDDYADIEIAGDAAAPAAAAPEPEALSSPALVLPPVPAAGGAPSAGRRTAHVLRRRGPPTKPPPAGESVFEILARDEAARAAEPITRQEEDFSDVASEISDRRDASAASAGEESAPAGEGAAVPGRRGFGRSMRSSGAVTLDPFAAEPAPSEAPLARRVERDATVSDDDAEVTTLRESETRADELPGATAGAPDAGAGDDDVIDPPTKLTNRAPARRRLAPATAEPSRLFAAEPSADVGDDTSAQDLSPAPALELRRAPRAEAAAKPAVMGVPMVPVRVKTPTSVPAMGGPPRDSSAAARPATAADLVFEDLAAGGEPELALDTQALPEQLPPLSTSALDEAFAQTLGVLEEDLETIDDREGAATLRLEAGRLAESLGEVERARGHYEAAVLADPRLAAAVRGLRRIALAAGDLGGATRQLDVELEVAGALERRPLGHYRADLLMAAAEQDLARVAVGEMLDAAPSDVRALIAQLELAYLDGRYDELGASLAQLAQAVSDAGLRAAADTARAVLSTRPELHTPGVGQLFLAAAADPSAAMARLAAARHLVLDNEPAAAAEAMTQVAFQIALNDKDVAAALAVRALLWGVPDGAVDLAATAAPADPIVAQTMVEAASPGDAAAALSRCADRAPSLARRSYLAGLAAEIDSEHASEHWAHVLAADPGDDYAAAQLRTSHVASDATAAAIEVDLAAAQQENRERSRLRGGFGLAGLGQMDRAIEVLREGRRQRPGSLPVAEALAEVYAQGGMWRERAELAEFTKASSEGVDPELAAMRSALAWEDAATAASGEEADHARRQAVAAWGTVLEGAPTSPVALGALLGLARALHDQELTRATLARAHAVERVAWMSSSLALRRVRHADLDEGDSLLRDAATLGVDDPRRLAMVEWYAARRGDLDDIVSALDDRARTLEDLDPAAPHQPASLRLRAAQIAVEANDPARAATLFAAVGEAVPSLSVVPDLLASARRRAGDLPVAAAAVRRVAPSTSSGDEFARWVREADYLAAQGDGAGALSLYQRALDLHPHDPLAAEPLRRLATAMGESAPVAALALGRLRLAEASHDPAAIADAYQVLADIDLTVRRDEGAALIALESAIKADPRRLGVHRQLAHLYAMNGQSAELLRIRRLQLEQVSSIPQDRAALLFDIASLAEREDRPDDEIAEPLAAALAVQPAERLGLFQLEMLVRRKGPSAQLAALEEQIARTFAGDGRAMAAFLTRAGETLAEIGDIEAAIGCFKRAEEACPGHLPALRGWRLAALKGQLWLDVADSAGREAAATAELPVRGALYHLAGVALMDKALGSERAMVPLSRALTAVPSHRDAFLRLRILLEEDARHEDLATLLARRLEVETDLDAKVELHRAIADLHRNFLSDREEAKRHYRAILDLRPEDLRTHGALSDIAWEQGEWAEAADALVARARLEREPVVLRTLYYRLGLIYADRLPDVPAALGWLQKALQYDPDDDATLVRLADLAAAAGEWKLALSACDRLVNNEADADRRVAHLHRVARIFVDGLHDRKRGERALNLALERAPTNEAARIELVKFYRATNDATSIRIHLTRVAGSMRARIEANPRDTEAYQVLSRTMSDRETAAAPGSRAVARVAAELALLTGGSGEPERRLVSEDHAPAIAALLAPDSNDLLFPRSVQGELRQMFHLLGDRLAKHVGVDLRVYGATRGERLRTKDSAVARIAQEVATGLGFGEIDVYVAARMPWVYATEPTSPVSLILGKELTSGNSDARVRFASAGALKLAACSLSIAARLPAEELGVLVVALLRLFQPEFGGLHVDQTQVSAQVQKLRRLIPTSLLNELRPYAFALDGSRLDPLALSTDLRSAGLRAGVVATHSILPALELLAAGGDPVAALSHPLAAEFLKFALGEDLVALAR